MNHRRLKDMAKNNGNYSASAKVKILENLLRADHGIYNA